MAVSETWTKRDLPILVEALRRVDGGDPFPQLEDIRAAVGLTVDEMRAGVAALDGADPPYLEFRLTMAGPARVGGRVARVFERTRRELGAWPTPESIVREIVSRLDEAAEAEPEPETKSRLRAAGDVIGSIAREILVDVIARQVPS
jgi:hypothetical protein